MIRNYFVYGDQSYSAFWFLVVIASIVAEHYTGNILLKGNQFNTKVSSLLGVDRDRSACKNSG